MSRMRSGLRQMVLVLGVAALIVASGCSSAKKMEDDGGVPGANEAIDNMVQGDSDSGQAMGLQTVHFPYDSSTIGSEAQAGLQTNAGVLMANPQLRIQIEGHCDERGSLQYNLALGERRANSTMRYLEGLGVTADRMTVISFGKEKLLDYGTTEAAHAMNRRANFVVISN